MYSKVSNIIYSNQRYFLSKSWSVVVADVDKEAGEIFKKEEEKNSNFKFVLTDVSSEDNVKSLVDEVIQSYKQINCLINNAALSNPYNTKLEDMKLEEWNKVMNVNLTSCFLLSKYCIPHLKSQKSSNIINIASTRALMSEPNSEAYSSSKGAIVSFTHSLANSLSRQIMVNCISPGWIETSKYQINGKEPKLSDVDHSQHLSGRVGKPEDIAEMCYFLAEQKGFITGQNFVIDGGMTKKMIYHE